MTHPRCPLCGEEFDLDDAKKAKRVRDVHLDWCEDVELARKRLELGLPAPATLTPDQREAAEQRADLGENVQTAVDDW